MKYIDRLIKSADEEELKELVDKGSKRLFDIPETDPDSQEMVMLGEYKEKAEKYIENWGRQMGISTGYSDLDALTKGLVGGELIVVAGETSHGKTALCVNIATRIAMKGHMVLFVTLEMTHPQLAARIAKAHGGEDWEALPILFQKQTALNWKDVPGLMRNAKEGGVELVVIDHLHYFTRELEKVSEDLGRITKEFKQQAIKHDLPVALVSHVRKKAGNKSQADNDELRGSSYVAQDADIVLFVKRKDNEVMEVTITKNRNRGFDYEKPRVDLSFNGTQILSVAEKHGQNAEKLFD